MSYYFQETDSRIIFTVPPEVSYSVPFELANETFGGNVDTRFLPLFKESDFIKSAWVAVQETENQNVARDAKEVLSIIQEIVTDFSQRFNLDLSHFPPLRAFNVEDGSVLIEWIFYDFRIGFTIEPNSKDSGWYLVSNKALGEISASGYILGIDTKTLVLWLLNFVLSHS